MKKKVKRTYRKKKSKNHPKKRPSKRKRKTSNKKRILKGQAGMNCFKKQNREPRRPERSCERRPLTEAEPEPEPEPDRPVLQTGNSLEAEPEPESFAATAINKENIAEQIFDLLDGIDRIRLSQVNRNMKGLYERDETMKYRDKLQLLSELKTKLFPFWEKGNNSSTLSPEEADTFNKRLREAYGIEQNDSTRMRPRDKLWDAILEVENIMG